MYSDQYRAFLIMLEALNKCMSYSSIRISIRLPSIDETKMACSKLIELGYDFKISSNNLLHIYRGDSL